MNFIQTLLFSKKKKKHSAVIIISFRPDLLLSKVQRKNVKNKDAYTDNFTAKTK